MTSVLPGLWRKRERPDQMTSREIARLFEQAAYSVRPSEVYRDWLAVADMTLDRMPDHAASVALTGQIDLVMSEPERELFARLETKYDRYWQRIYDVFRQAFQLLLAGAEDSTDRNGTYLHHQPGHPTYQDIVGAGYELIGLCEPGHGQFFTPEHVCAAMASLIVDPGLLFDRLKQALTHPENLAGQALLVTTGLFMQADALGDPASNPAFDRFLQDQILPAAWPYYEPVKVVDPACGAGRLLLQAAGLFPRWSVELGLVRFYGQDVAYDCILMSRINEKLYGLNGWALRWKLARLQLEQRLTGQQTSPAQDSPALAQEAQSAGKPGNQAIQLTFEGFESLMTQQEVTDHVS